MKLTEECRDLFGVKGDYYLVHCIASDLCLGAGIAVPMQQRFGLRQAIRASGESVESPTCILTGRVLNLITKSKSYGKPTYSSFQFALEKMREIVVKEGITKIAMPKIGCGLDRLQWTLVKHLIEETFRDIEGENLVCVWK